MAQHLPGRRAAGRAEGRGRALASACGALARRLDPDTGEFLTDWDDALDNIGTDDEPLHIARFGPRFDAQGVLAGSRGANRCIGYLTKYLT